jgi:2,3-bisphosphoglycerate-dependent phosphoglycerate mutase
VAATLLLARHGETDWNRERRWQGHADPWLNEIGREQAHELARQLREQGPEAVYSSDLARANETAEIVADELGLPIAVDPRLREVDVGDWSGLLWEEIEERFPDGVRRRLEGGTGWENGEEFDAMRARVVEALLEIGAAHEGGRVLVVTHGGPVTAAWLASGGAFDDRPKVSNCHVLPMRVEGGRIAPID